MKCKRCSQPVLSVPDLTAATVVVKYVARGSRTGIHAFKPLISDPSGLCYFHKWVSEIERGVKWLIPDRFTRLQGELRK